VDEEEYDLMRHRLATILDEGFRHDIPKRRLKGRG